MKRILLTIFQLAVTSGMLWWVFHDPGQRAQMAVALRTADYRWVGVGVIAYALVEFSAAVRWQILLRVQRIQLGLGRVSALFLIGMFYNQFLPGGTGGDIMKSYLLLKETEKKAGALLAVVFDRLIGLVALVTITITLVSLRFDLLSQNTETRRLLWILLFLLGSSVAFLITTFVISGFNLFHFLPGRFPGRDKLIEIAVAYHLYARHWIATLFAFGASLVAHLATFATFLCVAYAFANVPDAFPKGVNVINFFSVLPIERTITALPISFAGVGLREKILQIMLHSVCDASVAVAKLIGSMGFLIILFCSAPGGLVYFLYRPSGAKRHIRLREMEREVATLEHEIEEAEEAG
jgi:glycosyltransferase 2 family protein